MRCLIFLIGLGCLSACGQYREPAANCFTLLPRAPASPDCDFEPLRGPDASDQVHG